MNRMFLKVPAPMNLQPDVVPPLVKSFYIVIENVTAFRYLHCNKIDKGLRKWACKAQQKRCLKRKSARNYQGFLR
jgi:hypothetical protein